MKDFEGLSTIFFLLRVVGLLRGLAVKLGVRHSYLDTMAPLAKEALRQGYKELSEELKDADDDYFKPPPRMSLQATVSCDDLKIVATKLMLNRQLLG